MGRIQTALGTRDPEDLDWCSPLWVPDGFREVFSARDGVSSIHLDPCGNRGSLARVRADRTFMLPDTDGLKTIWGGTSDAENLNAYVNPPFGQYWIHPETKRTLTPGKVKRLAQKLVDDGRAAGLNKYGEADAKKAILEGYERHTIREWIANCESAHFVGMDIGAIHPAATGTSWWHDTIEQSAYGFILLRGRPKFELVDPETLQVVSAGDAAPMDCAISLWSDDDRVQYAFKTVFAHRGTFHEVKR